MSAPRSSPPLESITLSTETCSVQGCERPFRARGWCITHYERWRIHGDALSGVPVFGKRTDTPVRFWSKVNFTDSCWEWTSSTHSIGYGVFSEGRAKTPAHRWAYEFCIGKIPRGLVLDHLCRNPLCVHPDHLEPVTIRENVIRGFKWREENTSRAFCRKGHRYTPYYFGNGSPVCHECKKESSREWARRRRTGAKSA